MLRPVALLMIAVLAAPLAAQGNGNDPIAPSANLVFDFPLFDLPYQIDAAGTKAGGTPTFLSFLAGYESPSMEQSLALSADYYRAVHWGLKSAFGLMKPAPAVKAWPYYLKHGLYAACLLGFDAASNSMPFGASWLHEEYHRAILTAHGTDSFDMVYTFPFFQSTISVNRILDSDLVRFKAESPVDFVRAHVAGIEGEALLVERLERDAFFGGQDLDNYGTLLISALSSAGYVTMCSNPFVDAETDRMNALETDIPVRDFTGFDFVAWAYDLFRPAEPYAARGFHPTGVGIDRYMKTTDLAPAELEYLRLQGWLSWLNFASPMLYANRPLPLAALFEREAYGNIALRHILGSSGSDTLLQVFLRDGRHKAAFALHNYANFQAWFPALEAELIEEPVAFGPLKLLLSPRVIVGLQPRDQTFKTSQGAFFCYGKLSLAFPTGTWICPVASVEAKTAGWVAGNESTTAAFSFDAGIQARF